MVERTGSTGRLLRRIVHGLVGALAAASLLSCSAESDSDSGGNGNGNGGSGSGSGGSGGGSTTGNVTFSAMCALPTTCGGDLVGSWTLVDACVESPPEGFPCEDGERSASGTVTGSFSWSGTAVGSSEESDVQECGRHHETVGGSGGIMAAVNGNTITSSLGDVWTFCVDGDTLWLRSEIAMFPELTLVRYQRGMLPDQ